MAASSAMRPSLGHALSSCRAATTPTPAVSSLFPTHLSGSRRTSQQIALMSHSASLLRRHTYEGARDNRDNSKHRGESTLRRTGTRWKLSVSDEPLPTPVSKEKLPRVETDPNHGLWEFFQDRATVANPPSKDGQHGRAWTVEELRRKSWDDLHRLWWVCVKERNRLATAALERRRSTLGFGDSEAQERDRQVRVTMRAIKHVLTERFYTWEDAVKLAKEDAEVDLSGRGTPFTPMEYLEEDGLEEMEHEFSEEESKALEDGLEQQGEEDKKLTGGDKKDLKAATEVDPSTLPGIKANQDLPRV